MRKFVFDRAKQDTVGAAYALAYLLGASPLIPQTRSGIDGIFDAYLFSKGLLESGGEAALSANLQAFDELRTQFASLLQEDRDRLEQLASEHGALLSTLREHTDTEARAFDSVLEESKRKLEEHIEAGQKELKAIADAYDAKMAVQAPVTYWEQQCTSHRKLGILFGGVAFAWACVSVVLTYYVADKFLGAAPEQTVNVLGLDLPKVPLWHITLLVVVLTFAIWITRILVRLLLSQVHLHTDAGERVVMAKTYISLLREGQGPKDEDRQLILQTLFRPSQTGVVKDDAIPATVFEWITRGVTK